MAFDRTIRNLQRRLERWELEHLRQLSAELHTRLEQAEVDAAAAGDVAEMWQQHAMNLQAAVVDGEYATHRCIGIAATGELMVVKNDG